MFEDVGTVRGAITLALMVGGALGMAYAGVIVPLRNRPKADPSRAAAPVQPEAPQRTESPWLLRGWEIVAIVALCLVIFLGLLGPAWEGTYDVDRAVLVSYLPIPPLVLAFLLYRGRLRLRSFLVGSFVVACAKFGITAIIVIGALVLWGPGRSPFTTSAPVNEVVAAVEAPPTPIPAGSTGEIHGEVVDASGQPVASAIVYIRSGLEAFHFAPRPDAMHLTGSAAGMNHPPVVVQAGQPLRLRSTDGTLHTLAGLDADRRVRFHLPLLWGEGAPTVEIDHPIGEVTARCSVHAHLHNEADTRVVVLHHPYFTRTDHQGRFTLAKVPGDTELELAVALPEGDGPALSLPLLPGAIENIRLTTAG